MPLRNRRWSSPARGWTLAVGSGMLLLAFGLAWRPWWRGEARLKSPPPTVDDAVRPAQTTPVARAVKPPPTPTDGFVGSEACAKCHAQIVDTYSSHPMYRSAGRVPGEHEVEDFAGKTEFQPLGNRRYWVERTETEVVHHEAMIDAGGEAIADLAVPVRLFIGSGMRGKTYAVSRGGLLFESLISWYSGDGGRWDLSPGYESSRRRNFERRISGFCMMCHAGRVANLPGENDRFEEPILLEAAIGCERCHGPGAKHVARQEAGGAFAAHDDSIVNPRRLDPARRESICNQCHLQGEQSLPRYGRTFFDFRPGQLLDEVWTVSVSVQAGDVRPDGTTKAVSQVQQMRASACYRQSEGRMSCNSCHPAHSAPDGKTKADYYRGRCLECHAEQGCSLPEPQRVEPPAENSCIHCHMPRLNAADVPHTSQTDHRVRRSPDVQPPDDPYPSLSMGFRWELFDHAEERLAPWEVDRVHGLNLVNMAQRKWMNKLSDDREYREAEPLLRSSLRAAPDDERVLEALGQSLFDQGRGPEGRVYLDRLLEIQPLHEVALELLADGCQASGDFEAGVKYGERLLAANPWIARYYARQAALLQRVGKLDLAFECGEKALRLDPWQTQVRSWLVEAYRLSGDSAASERHAAILRRMRGG